MSGLFSHVAEDRMFVVFEYASIVRLYLFNILLMSVWLVVFAGMFSFPALELTI
ncbi:hypothetical protein [uncultured Methanocorpusculum sp.]|nr:hypothetical protein [uncultured Methanocorpusculum sp.]